MINTKTEGKKKSWFAYCGHCKKSFWVRSRSAILPRNRGKKQTDKRYCSEWCYQHANRRVLAWAEDCMVCQWRVGRSCTDIGRYYRTSSQKVLYVAKERGVYERPVKKSKAAAAIRGHKSSPEYSAKLHAAKFPKTKLDIKYSTVKTRDLGLFKRAFREREQTRENDRMANDPQYRIKHYLRKRLRNLLRGERKHGSVLDYLGCSIDQFKKHLEARFDRHMSWDNHGSYWHIDHIVPCASFDHTNEEELKVCWRYTNMQPMEAKANIAKGSKLQVKRYLVA